MLLKKIQPLIATLMVLGALLFPRAAKPEAVSEEDGAVQTFQKMDKHETTLQRARAHVLTILKTENGCSAWFREANDDPAGVFDSLNIEIAAESQSRVMRATDAKGTHTYKHPWGARSNQMAGRNSVVQLNPSGPFFVANSPIVEVGSGGVLLHYIGYRKLSVGEFQGNTADAQVTILLHELAHVIGRIPEDDDSWDGRSSRNTEEIIRNCKSEIENHAQRSLLARN